MRTSEKYIERKLHEQIKQMGGLCIKLTTEYGYIGLPDRLCLLPHRVVFFVEVKSTGQTPRKIQTLMHSVLRNLGFKVYIIDSIEQLNKLMLEIKNQ